MSDSLTSLARHVENDPLFLASLLRLYAESEGLDEARLAAFLGCTPENLTMIQLCQVPRPEGVAFREDVTQVAERFGADKQKLAEVTRRGQVLQRTRASQTPERGSLLAAREHEPEPPAEES